MTEIEEPIWIAVKSFISCPDFAEMTLGNFPDMKSPTWKKDCSVLSV